MQILHLCLETPCIFRQPTQKSEIPKPIHHELKNFRVWTCEGLWKLAQTHTFRSLSVRVLRGGKHRLVCWYQKNCKPCSRLTWHNSTHGPNGNGIFAEDHRVNKLIKLYMVCNHLHWQHSVGKSQKKSHSTLWVDKS